MVVQARKERERQAREQAILGAARRIAEDEGWDAVTTRRLAAEIEYSQPVLYGHFPNRGAIIAAAAVQGFAELADQMRTARTSTPDPRAALTATARAYQDFAARLPALYDAMFNMRTELTFAVPDSPDPLKAGFQELVESVRPFAGEVPVELYVEVFWSALHGVSALDKSDRLDPAWNADRLTLLVNLFAPE